VKKIVNLTVSIITILSIFVACNKYNSESASVVENSSVAENEQDIQVLPNDVVFKTGEEIAYYPKNIENIAFKGHTPYPIVTEVMKVEKNIYKLRITCALLSNTTADGTYSADVCYYLKIGDIVELNKPSVYVDEIKKLKVKKLSWNEVVFEAEKDEHGAIVPTEDSF
jgi:hypothetical protein